MFATTQIPALNLGFPDVCLTPAGPVPAPVPVPGNRYANGTPRCPCQTARLGRATRRRGMGSAACSRDCPVRLQVSVSAQKDPAHQLPNEHVPPGKALPYQQ